ncbi:HAAS signaling domain-containing protein [Knoellia sp. CPCC 206453]|uniref:HAAS signaling domain-containing protein n=1 Tax=Knoellia pratensis TaxID=3404796 RepID=UPI003619FDA2
MSTPVAHPLVSAYLRDLELLLHGVEPGERAEVLAGVHEHLDASLAPAAADDDVRQSLAELGSPQSVADEAYAGRPAPASAAPLRPAPNPWPAHVANVINGLSLALLALLTLLRVMGSGATAPYPIEWLFLGATFAIPWLLLVVLTSFTNAWGSGDKFRSILLYPMTLVTLAVATWLVGLAQLDVLELLAALLVLGGAVWTLIRLIRATRN